MKGRAAKDLYSVRSVSVLFLGLEARRMKDGGYPLAVRAVFTWRLSVAVHRGLATRREARSWRHLATPRFTDSGWCESKALMHWQVGWLAVHCAGQASVGFSVDQGVQEGDGVVLLDLDGEADARLDAVQMGEQLVGLVPRCNNEGAIDVPLPNRGVAIRRATL